MDSRFIPYNRKSKPAYLRPYEEGEDLSGVSVSDEDTPAVGGMIAVNPDNEKDQWYINEEYFKTNFETED